MIITQGLDSIIIPAHGRNVIIVDECNGPLEITAVITGLSGSFTFVRQPFDGRVKFEVGAIAKQVYRKVTDYRDPFDYSATTVYGTSDPYHFAALSILLFDGTSQINLSYRVLNAAIQLGDADLDSYVGSVLSYIDCPSYTPLANLDPIAFDDAFNGERGVQLTGNVILGNQGSEVIIDEHDFIDTVTFGPTCSGWSIDSGVTQTYEVDSFGNNVLKVEKGINFSINKSFTTEVGKRYRIEWDLTETPRPSVTNEVRDCNTALTLETEVQSVPDLITLEFTATGVNSRAKVFMNPDPHSFSSFKVYEVDYPFQDYDPDGDTVTVESYTIGGTTYTVGTSVVIPSVGTLVILANGDMTFTPNAFFTGEYVFQYTITDGNGGTDTAKVSLVISETGIYAEQYESQYE